AGILTNEVVCCGTLTRSSEKRKEVEETSKQGGSWKDNKKAKWEKDLWRQPLLEMKMWAHILSVLSVLLIIQKDPNVVTGSFSLNDHFATVLFDSGADFRFISTKFAPLLNVKPSIVSPGYVKLLVCHEKVVRILLEGGEVLRVQGEHTLGGMKTLMSTNATEPELSDIPITKEDHEVHLKLVLDLLKKERFKIETVKNWKAPTTPSEIQSFLGLAGTTRRFVANFSKIAKPITSLI
ncbi:hypothetical protein Tco_1186693, partial [Tanacetum coccineum]